MSTITIDDKNIEFTGSPKLIELARDNGIEIPHFCYHHALSISGNCRMCVVEIGTRQRNPETGDFHKDSCDRDIINHVPKPQISCSLVAVDGMVVLTHSEKIVEARKSVLEFILANHPLDCPVCDQAGECVLQDYAFQYGFAKSRFTEKKRIYEKKKISEVMTPEMNRCIHCDRCARFTSEIVNDHSFARTKRGNKLELATLPGKIITHNYQGNMVDICPVGALTLTDFRFKSRTWFLKFGLTLCSSCGKGCNVMLSYKDSRIFRLKPVFNEKVNSYWMCDYGRLRYQFLNDGRKENHSINGARSTLSDAAEAAAEIIKKASSIGVVASANETEESCVSIFRLFCGTVHTPNIDYRITDAQISDNRSVKPGELLLAIDKYPNSAGAKLAGLLPGMGGISAHDLLADPSVVDLLFIILDDKILENEELLKNLSLNRNLVILSPFKTKWDSTAAVSFASLAYTETSGSFTNIDGIRQTFGPVMKPFGEAADSSIIFDMIRSRLQ